MKKYIALLLTAAIFALGGCSGTGGVESSTIELTNVSYDPTREFYTRYNEIFIERQKEKGVEVEIVQSHGGSGSQAISVSQGLEADVVTLALEGDVQAIADAGLIDEGWKDELASDSAPYTSVIVFLVRAGNPRGIEDWDDLAREGVGVITPNPKTSGGARWNFLAAWAFGEENWTDEADIADFVQKLYMNVLVLDSGARGSTTSFVENKQGDVLIAWENEAYLTLEQYPGEYEIITPSISILCQPSVTVVDSVARRRGTEAIAREYLEGLYSDEAQNLAAEYYYRPSNPDILANYADTFDLNVALTNIEHFGGWISAQERFFADGGVFDAIYDR
ncbi:MAG: sulfate ABC transporter substrate-binding protein [Clostridia bacterium]|nr:sulfate ABC transporter substrate-binding protein [Clostridia bacterium]